MESQVAELARSLSGRDERFAGPVVLTCCDVYISELLIRELTPFFAEYPDIELGISNDSRSYDLSKREADVAVRILGRGSSPPDHLIGRRLAPVMVCNYVAKEHPYRDPTVPGSSPRWVAFDDRSILMEILKDSQFKQVPLWGSVSSLPLGVQATRAGFGISKLPTYVGDAEESLRRLDPPELLHVADLWLLSHADLRDNARLRETRARIVQAFEAHMDIFDGTHQCGA
jgi:DNA-binding transcriptional LysR family regulator